MNVKASGGTKIDKTTNQNRKKNVLANVAVRLSMTMNGEIEFIVVLSAIRRCVMANREVAYILALYYLDMALKSGKIARQTYEFLLRKLSEKYSPLVPKNRAL